MVEFALVFPVMMVITLLCVDYGRLGYDRMVVTNSALRGARIGAANPPPRVNRSPWEERVRSQILAEVQQIAGFRVERLVTKIVVREEFDLEWVAVSVDYPFAPLVSWPGMPSSIPLHAEVTSPVVAD